MVRTEGQGELEGKVQELSASGSHPIPRIDLYTFLTYLQLTLKFIRRFIIEKYSFWSNEDEYSVMVLVMANVASDQLCIPYHAPYVWPALNEKVPLTSYFVHFPCVPLIHSKGSELNLGFLPWLPPSFRFDHP